MLSAKEKTPKAAWKILQDDTHAVLIDIRCDMVSKLNTGEKI
jgi:hypothetical protein